MPVKNSAGNGRESGRFNYSSGLKCREGGAAAAVLAQTAAGTRKEYWQALLLRMARGCLLHLWSAGTGDQSSVPVEARESAAGLRQDP